VNGAERDFGAQNLKHHVWFKPYVCFQQGLDAAVFSGDHMLGKGVPKRDEVFVGEACAAFGYGFKSVRLIVVRG
jgi:hypothetical protein